MFFEYEYHTATVASERTSDSAAASSKRSACSETPFTDGWFRNSFVRLLEAWVNYCNKFGRVPTEHTSTIRLLRPCSMVSNLCNGIHCDGLIVRASLVDGSLQIRLCLEDFSRNSPAGPQTVSSRIEDREGFANCLV